MVNSTHNWHVHGHDWAVEFLRKGMAYGRTRHAYLITGTESIGKSTLAHQFALTLQCQQEDEAARPCLECRSCKRILSGNHPDMFYSETDPNTGALKIDTIREVIRSLSLKPYDSRYRIAIFHDFDRAQPRAQDALLKTLEEPPSYAILLLLAQSTENIMPTISSRCQLLPLRPAPTAIVKDVLTLHGADEERADLLARLSSGRVGWALESIRDEEVLAVRESLLDRLWEAINGNRAARFQIAEQLNKEVGNNKPTLRYILEIWQTVWRDILLLAERSPVKPCNSDHAPDIQKVVQYLEAEDALQALQATRTMLQTLRTNANVRLALEVMFLDYPLLE